MTAILEIDDLIESHNKITGSSKPSEVDKKIEALVEAAVKEFFAVVERNLLENKAVYVAFSSKRDAAKVKCTKLEQVLDLASDKIADMIDAVELHRKALLQLKKDTTSAEDLAALLILVQDLLLDGEGDVGEEDDDDDDEDDEDDDEDDEDDIDEEDYVKPRRHDIPSTQPMPSFHEENVRDWGIEPRTPKLQQMPPLSVPPAIERVRKQEFSEAEEMRKYVYERNQLLNKQMQENAVLQDKLQKLREDKQQQQLQQQQQQPQYTNQQADHDDQYRPMKRVRYFENSGSEPPAADFIPVPKKNENNHNNNEKPE
jgi:hypothetical protein